jgi:hypothetical protein
MRPVGSTSSSARYGAPFRVVRRLLPRDGVDALDGAIGGELGDRAHAVSLGREPVGTLPAMAVVKPFRALRFDESAAGPLETLVAPPYDVITDEQREELKREARTTSSA